MKTSRNTLVFSNRGPKQNYNTILGIYTVLMSSFAIAYTLIALLNYN